MAVIFTELVANILMSKWKLNVILEEIKSSTTRLFTQAFGNFYF